MFKCKCEIIIPNVSQKWGTITDTLPSPFKWYDTTLFLPSNVALSKNCAYLKLVLIILLKKIEW